MRKNHLYLLLALATALLTACMEREIPVVRNGASKFVIIISEQAGDKEKLAAAELKKYIERLTGAHLRILTDRASEKNYEINIGNTNRLEASEYSGAPAELSGDGFMIKSKGNRIFIAGKTQTGTLYGVYTLLDEYFGCRKLSAEVTMIPLKNDLNLPAMDRVFEPDFTFRELHMPDPRKDESYRNWHKLHLKEGDNEWGMFVHTFDDLVPAEKYFKDHPEYFSYLKVQRIPDGQLCLSNPEVFELVVKGLEERMAEKPGALYWSVSQNDTYKACECDECKKLYDQYGGYSGAMVWFVNRVAGLFPDRVISTLAYQYTRQAPTGIRPADNVNIMLCSIECNRSRPLATDSLSASFRKDVEDWRRLTGNIYMWDYVVQFRNLISPFPNLRVLKPNIQYFRDMGIKMMFQQGSGNLISEFYELRQYLIAKLLWDPDADVETLIDDFVYAYYGSAGDFIRQYITLMHDALEYSGGNLGIYGYPNDGIHSFLTPELISTYEAIFDDAESIVSNQPQYLERVQIARLPLEFAVLDISLRDVDENLTYFKKTENGREVRQDMLERLGRFTDIAVNKGITRYWEHGNPPEEYRQTILQFVESSFKNPLGQGKPVKLLTQASDKYPAGGPEGLTDGLSGINDYHYNWLGFEGPDLVAIIDLQEEANVKAVRMDFLQDNKSWVFLPQYVRVETSTDGENFTERGRLNNQTPAGKAGSFTETFEVKFGPVMTRFVKVTAKNPGVCPAWHPGAGLPSWIFCDEIIIR
ncbi:MAG: DUF4838 domain-containing protein [Bacteroidales bacterium]|nr:DUF4838 domain-containing protein [Bacteroidales bacterium]